MFTCGSRCGNFRRNCSKWKKKCILIKTSVQSYLTMLFWWNWFSKKTFCIGYTQQNIIRILQTNQLTMYINSTLAETLMECNTLLFKWLYLKTYFASFLYMYLDFLIYRPVVMMIQKLFPIFSWIIFPLIINSWCMWFRCNTTQFLRISVILNWRTLIWLFDLT